MTTRPESPDKPGARWSDGGARFRLRSTIADRVELCLFDPQDPARQTGSVPMAPAEEALWEVRCEGIEPGQLYGFRVHGPWDPSRGLRCNPAKLLVDPLAAAISGSLTWNDSLGDFHPPAILDDGSIAGDTAPFVPKSVVVDPTFDWQEDRPPRTPWSETMIYECHVRGTTRLHPAVPPHLRGRYLGLCRPEIIEHLLSLGVTAIELMPVQHFISEQHLHQLGLTNYFGYNPIAWIAPHAGYATGDRGQQVQEFKTMVRTLHRAGLEVLLDVVFNHTAEGNENGPTLCHRGVDNRAYYRLAADPRHYENYSGCGNTIHCGQPLTLETVLTCLRYWVTEMHVDGFRFDLATVLGREEGGFTPEAALFQALEEDPVLRRVKLIAEPWDVGPDGYQLGRFPARWREWNDRYRDATRAFWRGDSGLVAEMTERLEGSRDILKRERPADSASINFITSHDGYTLLDLVSYEHRHNWDNGEHNRDGHQHNLSRNWGFEGPTPSTEINNLRQQVMRNFIATLAFSAGVPMLSHGDELARTQKGNNNAYCQDGPLTWLPWQSEPVPGDLLDFTRRVFRLRRDLALGRSGPGLWLDAHADELDPRRAPTHTMPPFGWLRHHDECRTLTIFNGDDRQHLFELPQPPTDQRWQILVNTARQDSRQLRGWAVRVPARALLLLKLAD